MPRGVYSRRKKYAKPRLHQDKTQLNPQEKLLVAYMHECRHIEQQDLAVIFNVNSGRINEAIMAIRKAIYND
jgi:hypothetical protein